MSIACGSERPLMIRNSSTLSKVAVSLPPSRITGSSCCRSPSANSGDESSPSRARIQLMLPRSVLISPLWAMTRYGCASGHDGNVLVLKRWWTSASADSKSGSRRSRKNSGSCAAVSMPFQTHVRLERLTT